MLPKPLDTITVQNGPAFLPSEKGGLVSILSLDVPVSDNSEGAPLDVSGYIGKKTIEISGTFDGVYTILGSHDGALYSPLTFFTQGQELQNTIPFVVRFLKARRKSPTPVIISVVAQAACVC